MPLDTELTVIIADNIPSYNRGEAAILFGLLQSMKEAEIPISKIVLCSDRPDDDRRWYGHVVEIVDFGGNTRKGRSMNAIVLLTCGLTARLSPHLARTLFHSDLWRSYLDSDVILMGHDNTLAGGTAPSVWFLANAWFATLMHKPIAIVAGSVGPFNKGFATWMGRRLLNDSDLVTLRDPMSYRHCLALGLRHNRIYLTGDTAFLMQPASRRDAEAVLDGLGMARTVPIIGVTASRSSSVFQHMFELWGDNRPPTAEAREQRHVAELGKALDAVIDRLNVSILFLPHCIGPGLLDDRRVARKIRDGMHHQDRVWLLEEELSASVLKAVIGELDFFVGERTHSVIAALSGGVPAIDISFPNDYRTFGLLGELLGLPDHLYDVRELESESLADKIEQCWAKREHTRQHLQREIPRIQHTATEFGFKLRKILEARDSL